MKNPPYNDHYLYMDIISIHGASSLYMDHSLNTWIIPSMHELSYLDNLLYTQTNLSVYGPSYVPLCLTVYPVLLVTLFYCTPHVTLHPTLLSTSPAVQLIVMSAPSNCAPHITGHLITDQPTLLCIMPYCPPALLFAPSNCPPHLTGHIITDQPTILCILPYCAPALLFTPI